MVMPVDQSCKIDCIKRSDEAISQNLRDLYLVSSPPCDTNLREKLDDVSPASLRPAFKKDVCAFSKGKRIREIRIP